VGSRARLVLLAATVLAAVVLFLVLRPDEEEPTPSVTTTSETTTSTGSTETETGGTTTAATPSAVRIRIQARGDGSGSIRRVTIEQGQRVTLIVSADVADEVHVHGYDLMADIAPGSPARISFEASVPGRFDVELESRAIQIAELRVSP
jgi:ABC-type molybdate transport system substrate-binding protein